MNATFLRQKYKKYTQEIHVTHDRPGKDHMSIVEKTAMYRMHDILFSSSPFPNKSFPYPKKSITDQGDKKGEQHGYRQETKNRGYLKRR